jgi:phosphate uptake regulator
MVQAVHIRVVRAGIRTLVEAVVASMDLMEVADLATAAAEAAMTIARTGSAALVVVLAEERFAVR